MFSRLVGLLGCGLLKHCVCLFVCLFREAQQDSDSHSYITLITFLRSPFGKDPLVLRLAGGFWLLFGLKVYTF